jgi:hypothetical protein
MEIQAKNINPYLVDAENIIIDSRNKPVSDVPKISYGSMANDGGHLILDAEEREELLAKEPAVKKYVHLFLGSQEFINNEDRWCLWLKDVSPMDLRSLPEIMKRVEKVKQHRFASSREATKKLGQTPYLFGEIRQPESNYLLIPGVSSENRNYIPIGFMNASVIASDLARTVPNATLYHFGVLTSQMHMAWMRTVCGRLKGDYRYSNNIVYNNFPWASEVSEKQKEQVEKYAQEVLDARKLFPDSSLADLYDPSAMPKILVDAHRALDKAVDHCYRREPFKTELERLEFLFGLYRQYTEPLNAALDGKKKRKTAKKP